MKWNDLTRDEKAALIVNLYKKHGSIRKVSKILERGSTTVYYYLVYSDIPEELRIRYARLSLKAFIRAATSRLELERALEQEMYKLEYLKIHRRINGIKSQIAIIKKMLVQGKDKRIETGLRNKLEKLCQKLEDCSLVGGLI